MAAASDSEYWSDKLKELERGQLETVAGAATAWSALLAGLLGVFGLVTFACGLTNIDKLADPWAGRAKAITIVAALFLAAATIAAAYASQNLAPKTRSGMTWQTLEKETRDRAKQGLNWLRAAKVMGALAAMLVLGGSIMVIVVGEDASQKPPTVVAVTETDVLCGRLDTNGTSITVDGQVLTSPVELNVISKCP